MPIPQSKLNEFTPRHAFWVSSASPLIGETYLRTIEDLSQRVPKMGLMSAGVFLEHAGVNFLARTDPSTRRLLELAREANLKLTENGWEEI